MKKQLLLLCLCATVAVQQTEAMERIKTVFTSLRPMNQHAGVLKKGLCGGAVLGLGYLGYLAWYKRGLNTKMRGLGNELGLWMELAELFRPCANGNENNISNADSIYRQKRYDKIISRCKKLQSYMNNYFVPNCVKFSVFDDESTFTIKNEKDVSIVRVIDAFLKDGLAINLLVNVKDKQEIDRDLNRNWLKHHVESVRKQLVEQKDKDSGLGLK